MRFCEDDLIANFFLPLAGPAALGLKDDTALMTARPYPLAVTADMLVAGVHFFAHDPPELIAQKALRVNLSDLAAKGAVPLGFLLSIALPMDWTNDWLGRFAGGLAQDAQEFATPLIGGDTSSTPGPLTIAITALGDAPKFIARSGAALGDDLYVSGPIGDAALGLKLRQDPGRFEQISTPAREAMLARYLLPRPRLDLGEALRGFATAAMDVSDGLVGDLAKLTRASGVSAEVAIADIPFSAAAKQALSLDPSLLETVLTGGDDYEILFTCGQGFTPPPGVSRIGQITAGAGAPSFKDAAGGARVFASGSYRHF